MANLNTLRDWWMANHPYIVTPMAGVTNSAFRTIAKEMGAGLVCELWK